MPCLCSQLQQVLEVNILLIRHVLKTVLTVNLGTSLVELPAHGVVDEISWKAGCFTLICLPLLHPGDEEDLGNDNTPKNAPYGQDAFEGIDLTIHGQLGSQSLVSL